MINTILKKSSVGVANVLPKMARNILINAAQTKDLSQINESIKNVRAQWPEYFVKVDEFNRFSL